MGATKRSGIAAANDTGTTRGGVGVAAWVIPHVVALVVSALAIQTLVIRALSRGTVIAERILPRILPLSLTLSLPRIRSHTPIPDRSSRRTCGCKVAIVQAESFIAPSRFSLLGRLFLTFLTGTYGRHKEVVQAKTAGAMRCQGETRGAQKPDKLPAAIGNEDTLTPVCETKCEDHLHKQDWADDPNQQAQDEQHTGSEFEICCELCGSVRPWDAHGLEGFSGTVDGPGIVFLPTMGDQHDAHEDAGNRDANIFKNIHGANATNLEGAWPGLWQVNLLQIEARATMNHSEPQTLTVSDSQADHRLDKYIRSQVKGVPATVLFRVMRTKQITVNGAKCKPDQRTVVGDKVRLPTLEVAAEKPTPTGDRKTAEQLARRLSQHIVFEDSDLLVVNKPANIAVHVGSRVKAGVIEALRVLRPKEKKLELAHRLDKETSGLLMVAKNSKMLQHLQGLLRTGAEDIQRYYLAVVSGGVKRTGRQPQRIDVPLRKIGAAAEKGVRMLMLHACRLVVPLPDGEVLDVHAPMPPAWNKLRG